jgi:Domain of unknown function (DUF2828)
MNSFINAVKKEEVFGQTYNGALTLNTTGSRVLDLFNAAGNRNVVLNPQFDLARSEDPKLAYRVALWTRDIRGGAGERQTFRNLLAHLENHYSDELVLMIPKIPEVGRWDDLLVFETDKVKSVAFGMIRDALADGHGLAAKWMPRKGAKAEELRNFLGYTPKQYRKTLVNLTKVVESQMCAKDWMNINFDHVPSLASARYQKAFGRHCGDAYTAYKQGLVTVKEDGTTERKINAAAVFPYDVVKSIHQGDRQVAEAQWKAMPNFLGDNKILPIVDVSGSMSSFSYYGQRAPIKSNVTPMDVAISIGLYCADKQQGAFSGAFMTFSGQPKLQVLTGSLTDKINQLARAHWEMNTNIEAAFQEILSTAKRNGVVDADMPKVLLILSDMEFDSCVRGSTNFENMKALYATAGYTLPTVVFWTINGRSDNAPVSMHQSGACLVSGFSPSLFKSVLKTDLEGYTPFNVMLDVLKNPRYDVEGLTV